MVPSQQFDDMRERESAGENSFETVGEDILAQFSPANATNSTGRSTLLDASTMSLACSPYEYPHWEVNLDDADNVMLQSSQDLSEMSLAAVNDRQPTTYGSIECTSPFLHNFLPASNEASGEFNSATTVQSDRVRCHMPQESTLLTDSARSNSQDLLWMPCFMIFKGTVMNLRVHQRKSSSTQFLDSLQKVLIVYQHEPVGTPKKMTGLLERINHLYRIALMVGANLNMLVLKELLTWRIVCLKGPQG
jgi:hypothetical protein